MEKEEATVWKKIPRVSRTIPFGYEIDPEDPNVLLPIPLQLEALKLAKKHVKSFSYRQVSEWLEQVTGRKISYVGLRNRLKNDATRRGAVSRTKKWAERYEEAKKKAEALENRIGIGG